MADPRDIREALLEIEGNRLARLARVKQIDARLSELKSLKLEPRTETHYPDPVEESFLATHGFFPTDEMRKAERDRLQGLGVDLDSASEPVTRTSWSPEQIEIMQLEKEREALELESKIDAQMGAAGLILQTAPAGEKVTDARESDMPTAEPTVWKRTLRDFVDWIVGAREKGQIHAASDRQAVINTAKQFVTINPKTGQKEPIDGRSAWQSWKNRKDEGK